MENNNIIHGKILLGMQIVGAVLLCFYVYHANANATNGYILEGLHEERENIITERRMLNLKISRAQSIDNIEKDPYVQEMVNYGNNAIYIDEKATSGAVIFKSNLN